MSEEGEALLEEAENRRRRKIGLIAAGMVGGAAVAITAVAAPFVLPAMRKICLPYVPATQEQVGNVFKLLQGRSGTLVDLGSGDGRIVIAAAKQGFRAVGYELNPWLVWYSRLSAVRHGVFGKARFYRRDLFKANFAELDNVVIFGVPQLMPPLEEKLSRELQRSAKVVACRFSFPTWMPSQTIEAGVDSVWAYEAKDIVMRYLWED
uniref:ATP synthase subunit C lysine N-methyltransferase n=1 Tax=Branchiostoma floridae TaxID=7739 RepID=C3Z905_BRAFL|eukprot:XP_002594906.1 hypothetical protein BRAFLDRAFT_289562 [Branchiostoma floridae]